LPLYQVRYESLVADWVDQRWHFCAEITDDRRCRLDVHKTNNAEELDSVCATETRHCVVAVAAEVMTLVFVCRRVIVSRHYTINHTPFIRPAPLGCYCTYDFTVLHNARVSFCARLKDVSNGLLDVLGLHQCSLNTFTVFFLLCAHYVCLSVLKVKAR